MIAGAESWPRRRAKGFWAPTRPSAHLRGLLGPKSGRGLSHCLAGVALGRAHQWRDAGKGSVLHQRDWETGAPITRPQSCQSNLALDPCQARWPQTRPLLARDPSFVPHSHLLVEWVLGVGTRHWSLGGIPGLGRERPELRATSPPPSPVISRASVCPSVTRMGLRIRGPVLRHSLSPSLHW